MAFEEYTPSLLEALLLTLGTYMLMDSLSDPADCCYIAILLEVLSAAFFGCPALQ